MVVGFEDVWRPPVKPARVRHPETVLSQPSSAETRARLQRLAKRTPEVMVKVTGRTRGASHLQAHLDYITRDGELEAEDSFGNRLATRTDVRDLATDWSDAAVADRRRRANTPFSHSIILSMPAGTDALKLRDAARSFAQRVFAEQFDYLFVLHTDTPRPHVHLTVRSQGLDGAEGAGSGLARSGRRRPNAGVAALGGRVRATLCGGPKRLFGARRHLGQIPRSRRPPSRPNRGGLRQRDAESADPKVSVGETPTGRKGTDDRRRPNPAAIGDSRVGGML